MLGPKRQLIPSPLNHKMKLRNSLDKTNKIFHKSFKNLKTFIFGRYKKLPRSTSFNPFSCSSRKILTDDHFDRHYQDFLEELQQDQDNAKVITEKSIVSEKKQIKEEEKDEVEKSRKLEKKNCDFNGGSYRLAQKMKEMEMMDVGNMDHVLDIEEVLHYYSRLKSPVYLDIVDKFFMDMSSEVNPAQPSVSKTNSKRRLKPLKLVVRSSKNI